MLNNKLNRGIHLWTTASEVQLVVRPWSYLVQRAVGTNLLHCIALFLLLVQ